MYIFFCQTNASVQSVNDSDSPSPKKIFGDDSTKVVGSVINPNGFPKEGKILILCLDGPTQTLSSILIIIKNILEPHSSGEKIRHMKRICNVRIYNKWHKHGNSYDFFPDAIRVLFFIWIY